MFSLGFLSSRDSSTGHYTQAARAFYPTCWNGDFFFKSEPKKLYYLNTSYSFSFLKVLFVLFAWLFCVHGSWASMVPMEIRRNCQIPWDWSFSECWEYTLDPLTEGTGFSPPSHISSHLSFFWDTLWIAQNSLCTMDWPKSYHLPVSASGMSARSSLLCFQNGI